MNIFGEIKRRARNVALAARGKDVPQLAKLEPVKIKVEPLKIATFAAEHFIEVFADPKVVIDFNRRKLAEEIGRNLLDAGVFAEEINQRPLPGGLQSYSIKLVVKVAVPEEAKNSD